jgi:hypothetical protein
VDRSTAEGREIMRRLAKQLEETVQKWNTIFSDDCIALRLVDNSRREP